MGIADDNAVGNAAVLFPPDSPNDERPSACSVRLLGTLEVRSGTVVAELGSPKQRALLAILVLHANEIVATDRLIELLWDDVAPRTADHSIQIYVSELRKAMGRLAFSPVIVTRPPGYLLQIEPSGIDVLELQRLARDAHQALRTGDNDSGLALLRSVVRLSHGDPLADFTYEAFAQPHIRRLNAVRFDAVEELAAAELEHGNAHEALRLAESIIASDPLRERGHELMMRALYCCGRHVHAVRSYQHYRELLAEEFGIVPAPRLQRLHEQILVHDSSLQSAEPSETTAGGPVRNPARASGRSARMMPPTTSACVAPPQIGSRLICRTASPLRYRRAQIARAERRQFRSTTKIPDRPMGAGEASRNLVPEMLDGIPYRRLDDASL